MIDNLVVRARTALSPEWDRGFDDAFAELVSSDPDLVQAEFDDLIANSWIDPSDPGPPPGLPAPTARSASSPGPPGAEPATDEPDEASADHITDHEHPPP